MVKTFTHYNNHNYNEFFGNYSFDLSDFQKAAIESTVTGNHCLVTSHTGSGKCLKIDTEIVMFDGSIKKVQDVKVGDKLMGDDSTERNVLGLARGIEPMYEIKLSDGDSFTCNESHILCLKYNVKPRIINNKNSNRFEVSWFDNKEIKMKYKSFNYKNNDKERCFNEANILLEEKLLKQESDFNISVKDFLTLSKYLQRNSLSYKVGIEFNERNIQLDPYILGLWLGDGHSSAARITNQDATILKYLNENLIKYDCFLKFISNYEYSFHTLKEYTRNGRKNNITTILRNYNLLNNKHIPDDYKINSRENRLKLLAGLIDSDGYYQCKTYEISQKNNILTKDIVYLAKSLGFACTCKKVSKSCMYKNVKREGEYNRITIFGDGLTDIPVLCKRKKYEEERIIKKPALEYFFKIEAKGIDNYYGFELDGNHKFILGNFIVTHNTLPAEFAIEYFKKQSKKVIYTGPIKALCNQKLYDFRRKFPHISFGILTGDIKDNPEADVLIMTTEILRNTLFNKEIISKEKTTIQNPLLSFEMDFDTELGAVVFDEIHYISDEDRGSVWEQSIILLPDHIQLIMLSATIQKPELFAKWIEDVKNCNNNHKQVYLCSTYERVVPLIHYNWLSCLNQTKKKYIKVDENFKYYINKPLTLSRSDGNPFLEDSFRNLIKYQKMIENENFIKRQYVLNDIVKHLLNNDMLPALCFIFSRKNVQIAAKEINFSLFDPEDKTPSIIENECKQILIKKLPNYKEYLKLPEYIELIDLLKKGIAIHHAGIMPILREIVELLFEKNYIKLLFATETFAVGINMPTKTVIFTSLYKFDNNGQRELYSHEYTQMAGRAGRRGLDKIGHVIHCNNLFKMDQINYKKILTGGAKLLSSKFKISFNLILNIIYSNNWREDFNKEEFKAFIEKSMISENLAKEQNYYLSMEKDIQQQIDQFKTIIDNLKTPESIILEYKKLKSQTNLRNNQKKKVYKQIQDIENQYKLDNDLKQFNVYEALIEEQKKNIGLTNSVKNYIDNNIQNILDHLISKQFIDNNLKILHKGIIASQIQEVHSLVMGEIYTFSNGFESFNSNDLILIFSCFTNINIDDDYKILACPQINLFDITKFIKETNEYYEFIQSKNFIPNDSEIMFHMDLIDILPDWINSQDVNDCLIVLEKIKNEKYIFLGDFVKAILKINTIALELEKISDLLNNLELKLKLQEIPNKILKFVATNQSLYI
jgi:superfamily II RNA helicase